MESYLAYNTNDTIRKNSSSGGIFYELAKQIISENGIVFGAAWNKDWDVDIIDISKIEDIPKLQQSKYVKANLNNAFEKCKEYLDNNRKVLYSGTPCQLMALKKTLGKNYSNLITVEITCHGTMPKQIWLDYLETIKRPDAKIISINMRSKENTTWEKYNFEVKYSDGKKFTEEHSKNKYMKAFLSDKYLNTSCYSCVAKSGLQGDIVLGDYWGVNKYHSTIDTKYGVSFIIANSEKGKNILKKLTNIKIVKTNIENIRKHNVLLNPKRDQTPGTYRKSILQKKVGVIAQGAYKNIGGLLNGYSLVTAINELDYDAKLIIWDSDERLSFMDKNCPLRKMTWGNLDIKEDEFDILAVGSDQTWRKKYQSAYGKNRIPYAFMTFSNNWNKVRFSYATSIGVGDNEFEYPDSENKQIQEILNQYNYVSVRELESVNDCKKHWGIDVKQFIDPTMLLPKEHYINLCKDIPNKPENELFCYILDTENCSDSFVNDFSKQHNFVPVRFQNTGVEDWLAHFRDAKFIITDSFHGCIFSIIFNKPFLYYKNEKRGGIRFSTMEKLFKISNREIKENNEITVELLKAPNIDYKKYVSDAKKYLKIALADCPKIMHIGTPKPVTQPTQKEKQNPIRPTTIKSKTKDNSYFLYF